ncbi:MAG: radical SAM protein [Nitrospiraceae bacterium]|nr:MAG: radical SAM protein [Nitrospiraceae bacterium]
MPIKINYKKTDIKAYDIRTLPLRFFYSAVAHLYNDDARISQRLYNFFPTYRSAFGEVQNQLHRVCRRDTSYEVQGVHIEPTNICNLKCRHCSTQRIPNDKKGFMRLDLFKKILNENPQLRCIILTRNGEPFAHNQIFDMIRLASDKGIYISLYSNGILLNDDNIPKIFESGLNEITFSMEGVGEYYKYNRGKPYEAIEAVINSVLEQKKKRNSPLLVGINATVIEDSRHVIDVKETWENIVDYVIIEPLMGGNKERRVKPCRTLWRNLVITWNGNVVPCCIDMAETLPLGDANKQSLREIFNGPKAQALRKRHLQAKFPKVCSLCYSYM